jgi:hypothetical protein
MPSIAANNAGSVVIGFSRTGLDEFPSAYAAVGHTAKGKTTFDSPILLKAGEGLYHFFIPGQGLPVEDRWGDFSATQLDPKDPNTFWTFQEWAAAPFAPPLFGVIEGRWATQVTQITVPTQNGANNAEALAVDLTGRPQAQADAAAGAVLRAAMVAPRLQLTPKAKYTPRSR